MTRLADVPAPVSLVRLRHDRWSSFCPDCGWEDTDTYPTRGGAVLAGNEHLCIPQTREPHPDGVVIVDLLGRPVDAFSRPWEVR